MRIIEPSFEFLGAVSPDDILQRIELAGRVCYKSEDRISEGSACQFVRKLIASGHESVIEHSSISVRIICDRGVSHELVRHRIASYSQESTRYCNYHSGKFSSEITVIKPCFWSEDSPLYRQWEEAMKSAEQAYMALIAAGAQPQEARSVLPNSLKTEIIVTMNLREWRHFFSLRTAIAAHPQMREIASKILLEFVQLLPDVFGDLI